MSAAQPTASMAAPEPRGAERELVITRVIDAPRSRVFTAWTDPTQVRGGPEAGRRLSDGDARP